MRTLLLLYFVVFFPRILQADPVPKKAHSTGSAKTANSETPPSEIEDLKRILFLAKKNPSTGINPFPPTGKFKVFCVQGTEELTGNAPTNSKMDPFSSDAYQTLSDWRHGSIESEFEIGAKGVTGDGRISNEKEYRILPHDPSGYYRDEAFAFSPERKSWHFTFSFEKKTNGANKHIDRQCDMRFGKTDGGEDFIVMRTSEIHTSPKGKFRQEDYCLFNRR